MSRLIELHLEWLISIKLAIVAWFLANSINPEHLSEDERKLLKKIIAYAGLLFYSI
jgi:hypothetical protein